MHNKSKLNTDAHMNHRPVSPCDLKSKNKKNKENHGKVHKATKDMLANGKTKHVPSKSAL